MTIESAIKGVLEIAEWFRGKYEQTQEEDYENDAEFLEQVAELLKAQEPVNPIRMNHIENKYQDNYICPICKEDLSYEQNYCSDCGRAVKWE